MAEKQNPTVPDSLPASTLPHRRPSRLRMKSRTGCATCRRRRKKCDEKRPVCDACLRLTLHCSWSRDGSDRDANSPPEGRHAIIYVPPTRAVSDRRPLLQSLTLSNLRTQIHATYTLNVRTEVCLQISWWALYDLLGGFFRISR